MKSQSTAYNFVDVASFSVKVILGCYPKIEAVSPNGLFQSAVPNIKVDHDPTLNLFQLELPATTSATKKGVIDLKDLLFFQLD